MTGRTANGEDQEHDLTDPAWIEDTHGDLNALRRRLEVAQGDALVSYQISVRMVLVSLGRTPGLGIDKAGCMCYIAHQCGAGHLTLQVPLRGKERRDEAKQATLTRRVDCGPDGVPTWRADRDHNAGRQVERGCQLLQMRLPQTRRPTSDRTAPAARGGAGA